MQIFRTLRKTLAKSRLNHSKTNWCSINNRFIRKKTWFFNSKTKITSYKISIVTWTLRQAILRLKTKTSLIELHTSRHKWNKLNSSSVKKKEKLSRWKNQTNILWTNTRKFFNNWHRNVTTRLQLTKHSRPSYCMQKQTSSTMKRQSRRRQMVFQRLTNSSSNKDKSMHHFKETLNSKTSLMGNFSWLSSRWRWSRSNKKNKETSMSKTKQR